ncbi:hypothetical protein diail_5440 [Diaporthe ilicicola]|nr:hypothetical protein diail_5440 [Diaporthe ilicicola]
MTMIVFLVFCVFWALLGTADTPGLTTLPEVLATIAEHVRPPLPTSLMAAAILVVVFTCLVNPLSAAWSRLARTAARAKPGHAWVKKACIVVKWVDAVVSVFKSEDKASAPAAAAEAAAKAAQDTAKAAQDTAAIALRAEADRAVAQSERDQARAERDQARADLNRVRTGLSRIVNQM